MRRLVYAALAAIVLACGFGTFLYAQNLLTLPNWTTSTRVGNSPGAIGFNTQTNLPEYLDNTVTWHQIQSSPPVALVVGSTAVTGGSNGFCLTVSSGVVGNQACGGSGTITIGSTPVSGGTTGNCLTITAGVVTNASCGSGGGGTGANPTATAGPTAVNGTATTFLRSDGAPAIQLGTNVIPGLGQGDGTSISFVAGIAQLIGLNGLVSISAGCGNSTGGGGVAIGTVNGILRETRAIATFPDTMLASDCGGVLVFRSASPVVENLPVAGSTGFAQNFGMTLCNEAAGTVTLTPASGTIGSGATFVLAAGTATAPTCIAIYSGTYSGGSGAFVANDYGVLSHS